MKIIVLACLVAVCCAQPQPVRPHISETFTSEFDIFERRHGQEIRGTGAWDRSVELKQFLEIETFTGGLRFEVIGDFNNEIRYEIINQTKCEARKMEGQPEFPEVWKWLDEAKFHEFKDPRTNKTYDAWSEHSDRGSRTLLFLATDPNKPVAFMERMGDEEREMRFTVFQDIAPDEAGFKPPASCMSPPPRRNVVLAFSTD